MRLKMIYIEPKEIQTIPQYGSSHSLFLLRNRVSVPMEPRLTTSVIIGPSPTNL